MSDENWLKILSGEVQMPNAPVMPDENVQITTTGRSGERVMADALMFKSFLKSMLATHARPLSNSTRILEFGCGWGRILRTFLDEVDPEFLLGIDAQEWLLEIARETTRRSEYNMYRKTEPLPERNLPESSFDLIYAYSVFSHLSEHAANAWITEFERLLAPGGIICVTTRPRAHLEVWRKGHEVTVHTAKYAEIFNDVEADLSRYDRGDYVFHGGGSYDLSSQHYGEAAIPEQYARKRWTEHLSFVGFFERYSESYLQPAIVLKKND